MVVGSTGPEGMVLGSKVPRNIRRKFTDLQSVHLSILKLLLHCGGSRFHHILFRSPNTLQDKCKNVLEQKKLNPPILDGGVDSQIVLLL